VKHAFSQDPADLVNRGPLIRVALLPHPMARSSGEEDSSPISAQFLLDTGAQHSFVERGLAITMGLSPLRYVPIIGVSHKSEDCPVYPMTIRMDVQDGQSKLTDYVDYNTTVVGMRCPPDWRGLLGRDFLRRFRMIYDGSRGLVELHVPSR
jgi:hypothetical protein